METPSFTLEQRLAAVIHLLSSAALNGATPRKAAALHEHLRCAAAEYGADPALHNALIRVLTDWRAACGALCEGACVYPGSADHYLH